MYSALNMRFDWFFLANHFLTHCSLQRPTRKPCCGKETARSSPGDSTIARIVDPVLSLHRLSMMTQRRR